MIKKDKVDVVFGAFSSDALKNRINDSECKLLITQDNGVRGTKHDIPMKENANKIADECPSLEKIVVVDRCNNDVEMQERVEKVISEYPEAVGLNNHQGSKATADKRIMNIVSNVLKRHGKYFIDSRTTSQTVAEDIMRTRGVPTARRHVFLDNDNDKNLLFVSLP